LGTQKIKNFDDLLGFPGSGLAAVRLHSHSNTSPVQTSASHSKFWIFSLSSVGKKSKGSKKNQMQHHGVLRDSCSMITPFEVFVLILTHCFVAFRLRTQSPYKSMAHEYRTFGASHCIQNKNKKMCGILEC
jgi:hypothetical protein